MCQVGVKCAPAAKSTPIPSNSCLDKPFGLAQRSSSEPYPGGTRSVAELQQSVGQGGKTLGSHTLLSPGPAVGRNGPVPSGSSGSAGSSGPINREDTENGSDWRSGSDNTPKECDWVDESKVLGNLGVGFHDGPLRVVDLQPLPSKHSRRSKQLSIQGCPSSADSAHLLTSHCRPLRPAPLPPPARAKSRGARRPASLPAGSRRGPTRKGGPASLGR